MNPRAVWVLLAIAAATGLTITGRARGWTEDPAGAAQLARYVGAALAIGVAGALDTAGWDVADAAPRPRWRRHVTSLVPAVVPLALAAAVLRAWCVPHARPGVVGGLALEAAVMMAAAVGGAAMSRERPGQPPTPATTAAVAGPLILLLLTPMAPARLALVVDPQSPTWSSAHLRWALLGILLLGVIAHLWADPGRPRGQHRPGGRRTSDANEAMTTTGVTTPMFSVGTASASCQHSWTVASLPNPKLHQSADRGFRKVGSP